jgi:hypothetical protein
VRQYYSTRAGKNENFRGFDSDSLKKYFLVIYRDFARSCYFSEHLDNFTATDINGKLLLLLRRDENFWPIENNIQNYTEDDLFDIIEFLYDNISKRTGCDVTGYNFRDWDYDQSKGQQEFRQRINEILIDYKDGYELTNDGEICIKGEHGLSEIFNTEIPKSADKIVKDKVNLAIKKYRCSRSNLDERRIAIRELADILENLRPKIKKEFFEKDENDLFNIANNYCIRHLREKQKNKWK